MADFRVSQIFLVSIQTWSWEINEMLLCGCTSENRLIKGNLKAIGSNIKQIFQVTRHLMIHFSSPHKKMEWAWPVKSFSVPLFERILEPDNVSLGNIWKSLRFSNSEIKKRPLESLNVLVFYMLLANQEEHLVQFPHYNLLSSVFQSDYIRHWNRDVWRRLEWSCVVMGSSRHVVSPYDILKKIHFAAKFTHAN